MTTVTTKRSRDESIEEFMKTINEHPELISPIADCLEEYMAAVDEIKPETIEQKNELLMIFLKKYEPAMDQAIKVANQKKESVADKLIHARGSLNKQTVCDAVGISENALSAYESGLRIPRDEIKTRLAFFYGKSVAELFC